MTPRGKWLDVNCQHCGKLFAVPERFIKRGRGKYCSAKCLGLDNVARMNATRKAAVSNSGWFTSERVAGDSNPRWKPPVELVCKNCNQSFEIKDWILRQPRNKGMFCSTKCRGEFRAKYQSGEQSPFWVGGPPNNQRARMVGNSRTRHKATKRVVR